MKLSFGTRLLSDSFGAIMISSDNSLVSLSKPLLLTVSFVKHLKVGVNIKQFGHPPTSKQVLPMK